MTMDLQEALNAISERLQNLEKFCETVADKLVDHGGSLRSIQIKSDNTACDHDLAINELVKRTEELPLLHNRMDSLDRLEAMLPTAEAIAALSALIADIIHRIGNHGPTCHTCDDPHCPSLMISLKDWRPCPHRHASEKEPTKVATYPPTIKEDIHKI